jgi:glutamyl-tRNA(Gln) amidotransferase subunit E
MDYKKLGLTVGIEIHQELATKHKLFCACPPRLSDKEPDYTFIRKLRPSQSELGEVDPAALFEFLKGKTIIYQGDNDSNCLVEMDEEPPGPLDPESIDIALIFSLVTGATPVDEIHVMRKTVVDGSNTGGFQRTCVVSLGGEVSAENKKYNLEQIAIEEDAARKIDENGDSITYRLDRLGIPLIEITTAPEMHTPEETHVVAARIGSILRATDRVRRGLGTIRQDVNVSIKGGEIIEIKGVQDLRMLNTVVEYEAQRQASLIEISKILSERRVQIKDLVKKIFDVSEAFRNTKSRILQNALKKGGVVLAVKLSGFQGLTGKELCPDRRLGTEFSDHAKFMGNVKGIFHTDELPNYSITESELLELRKFTEADEDDAVVIVADEVDKCRAALIAVVDRAIQALKGVPAETRAANPDGTTRFTRPRPGAARMYPETDVKPVQVTEGRLDRLKLELPEMPEARLKRFQEQYYLNEKLASQIVDSDYMELFEDLVSEGASSTLLAVTLTEDLTRLRRDGVLVDSLGDEKIRETFNLINRGAVLKESVPDILSWLASNPDKTVDEAIEALGLNLIPLTELQKIIRKIVEQNSELLGERGARAKGSLMGLIMSKVRGRADAKEVNEILDKVIKEKIE